MKPIEYAIKKLGSVAALARGLQVTSQAVCFWRDEKRKIPADKCPEIEKLTGVRCEALRPDVDWAYLRGTAQRQSTTEAAHV